MSVYFQHLVFLRPFHTGVFQRGAIRTAGKKKERKKKNPKPDIHTINLQRQYKEIQHIEYEDL